MMTTNVMTAAANNDADLVNETLSGNRDAFGVIVSRYQSLICSLTYSATGNLGQSEDLAQETFITAWKNLRQLREREKLRSWLCGIARNRINNFLRREGREPNHKAESIEEISETHSPEPLPVEHTISKEEAEILWRALEKIPEIYREPLVLFYREHQSIAAVAEKLELSEDNVKQRLSRGRKLLQEQVLAFVEGALAKTNPGKNFTLAVVAALPFAVVSTKAATVGSAIAKGSVTAKGVLTFGTLGSAFALLGGLYLTLRSQSDNTKSPREKRFLKEAIGLRFAFFLGCGMIYYWLVKRHFTDRLSRDIMHAAVLFFLAALGAISFSYTQRRQRQIQIEDGTYLAAEWEKPRRETEMAEVAAGKKSSLKILVECICSMAFVLVMMGIFFKASARDASASHQFGKLVGPLVFVVGLVFLSFRGWWHRPRFISPKLSWQIALPIIMGVMTLLSVNQSQYLASAGIGPAGIGVEQGSPLATIIIFNAVVILAYAALIGILIWQHKTKSAKHQK